jgi:N-acetylmuramoyl-L-alanine amidase
MRKTKVLCFILAGGLVFLAGCATAPSKRPGALTLKDMCDRNSVTWQMDSVSQVITLRRGEVKASALVGSDLVMVDGQQVRLSAPVERKREIIIVPQDFENKVLDRLRAAPRIIPGPARTFKVIIDPGHGGNDPGATSRSGIKEKNINLDVAKKLRDELQRQGIDVVMTRARDESVSLERRTEIATKANADLYVSVHANSNPSSSLDGIEVYVCKVLGTKEKNDEQLRRNYDLLYRTLNMENDKKYRLIVADMMMGYKRSESSALASQIASKLVRELRVSSHGVKSSGFFVVRNTLMPAVLVEIGFLTNPREEKLLNTAAYRQKVADSLADSIVGHFTR